MRAVWGLDRERNDSLNLDGALSSVNYYLLWQLQRRQQDALLRACTTLRQQWALWHVYPCKETVNTFDHKKERPPVIS